MTVCRQVMSLTTPVVPWMRTRSPGWITLPSMSPNPLMMFAIVSCIPREIATPPTPSAASSVVGLTPNTGCSTMVIAAAQMITRRMLAKIDAFGMLARSRTSLVMRARTLVAIMATAITITSRMILPVCCCSHSVITSITRPVPVMRSSPYRRRSSCLFPSYRLSAEGDGSYGFRRNVTPVRERRCRDPVPVMRSSPYRRRSSCLFPSYRLSAEGDGSYGFRRNVTPVRERRCRDPAGGWVRDDGRSADRSGYGIPFTVRTASFGRPCSSRSVAYGPSVARCAAASATCSGA